MINKGGDAFREWPMNVQYTETELRRVHNNFNYAESVRLLTVMRRGVPDKAAAQDLNLLEKISKSCPIFRRHAEAPHRFCVSQRNEDCIFNGLVLLDLMKLEKGTVLHIVDVSTKFSSASFTERETTNDIWNLFVKIWVNAYLGYPAILAYNQSPQFTSSL